MECHPHLRCSLTASAFALIRWTSRLRDFYSTEDWFPDFANYRRDGYDFDARFDDELVPYKDKVIYDTVADFVYMKDRYGQPYGWGVAEYTTPEYPFGYDAVTSAYGRNPKESKRQVLDYLTRLLPEATETQIEKLLK